MRDVLMRGGFLALFLMLAVVPAQAEMKGRYVERDADSKARLRIVVDKQGHVSGELRLDDNTLYQLNGENLENSAQGALKGSGKTRDAYFYAEEGAGGLMLQVIPRRDSKPDLSKAQIFIFVAEDSPRQSPARETSASESKIVETPELRSSMGDPEIDRETHRLPQQPPIRR